ncbi:hypothetical protein [Nostoc sp. ChiSLP03a]|uniref:hypothetical protein n=1 Tax=Nostoc sp. ChiSLP03a TaxID=3075380 RepID=UPI002AD453B3|nr:hypothetical protein [Nostoc sp. ChiSLP03a]MDZ8211877.1 hypothetical protein [Nostoc sp. ChiSLP03a]
METILIRPQRLRQFGASEDSHFCVVTNSSLINQFQIVEDSGYTSTKIVPYDAERSFEQLLDESIPEPAHVLVISPQYFFESPAPEKLGQRKLVVMPCNSTPTSLLAIQHFLGIMERTDPEKLEAFADRFFELGRNSEYLEIINEAQGTKAIFEHLDDSYEWNQQAGFIEWGEQQIAPGGELSALPDDIMRFNANLRLAVNGEIALQGQPTVHSGAVSFLPEDRARIYKWLECMRDRAVIATVKDGLITELRASHPEAQPAVDMLNNMFMLDSRYRIIWEMGFGINTAHELLPGNSGMNETYGGSNGVFHLGIGLTPYTQYALILICPDTQVLGRNGEALVGKAATLSATR